MSDSAVAAARRLGVGQAPSVPNRTLRRVEAIERRAAWVTISVVIMVAFGTSGGFVYGSGPSISTWELIVYVGGLICLAAAGLLLVGALAPDSVRPFSLEDRTRFVFFAFALLVVAVFAVLGLTVHAAIEAHRNPQGFGG